MFLHFYFLLIILDAFTGHDRFLHFPLFIFPLFRFVVFAFLCPACSI